ncbi:MAG: DUF190 domain-containing protein [Acidobacteriaceae bacterium]|nr:DUF190 domain-containing protein [Acidobacteriaceae bacterium]
MRQTTPAKILRIHISQSDQYQGKSLLDSIMAKCREMNIAGATVFRGLEGYGETAAIHRRHLGSNDEPLIIVVVDVMENIEQLIPEVERMMTTGVLATSGVEMMRVDRTGSV